MKASHDTVVGFRYRVSGEDGSLLEALAPKDPPVVTLLGHGQVVPGIENALEGHEAGDSFDVEVTPDEGYGPRRDDAIQRVPKKYFDKPKRLKPGMVTALQLREGGQQRVTVHKVGMSTIDIDLNHPLAGKTLHFALEIVEVREATPEELAHGHAHPPETGSSVD